MGQGFLVVGRGPGGSWLVGRGWWVVVPLSRVSRRGSRVMGRLFGNFIFTENLLFLGIEKKTM